MIYRVCLGLFVAWLVAAISVVEAQTIHGKKKLETVWSGTAGSFRWKWTTQDLTAASACTGRTAFSALGFEKRTSPALKGEKDDPIDPYVECSVQPFRS